MIIFDVPLLVLYGVIILGVSVYMWCIKSRLVLGFFNIVLSAISRPIPALYQRVGLPRRSRNNMLKVIYWLVNNNSYKNEEPKIVIC